MSDPEADYSFSYVIRIWPCKHCGEHVAEFMNGRFEHIELIRTATEREGGIIRFDKSKDHDAEREQRPTSLRWWTYYEQKKDHSNQARA